MSTTTTATTGLSRTLGSSPSPSSCARPGGPTTATPPTTAATQPFVVRLLPSGTVLDTLSSPVTLPDHGGAAPSVETLATTAEMVFYFAAAPCGDKRGDVYMARLACRFANSTGTPCLREVVLLRTEAGAGARRPWDLPCHALPGDWPTGLTVRVDATLLRQLAAVTHPPAKLCVTTCTGVADVGNLGYFAGPWLGALLAAEGPAIILAHVGAPGAGEEAAAADALVLLGARTCDEGRLTLRVQFHCWQTLDKYTAAAYGAGGVRSAGTVRIEVLRPASEHACVRRE